MSAVKVFVGDIEVDRVDAGHLEWLITAFARRWAERRLGTSHIELSNANDPARDGAVADLLPVQMRGPFYDS